MELEKLMGMVQRLKTLNHQNLEDSQRRMKSGQKSSYECELCSDTGWIERVSADGKRTYRSCRCREEKKIKSQWKAAGINLELSQLTFANFKEDSEGARKMKKTAIAYFSHYENIKRSRNNSILFCGQPGSGKTHISIALAINFIKSGVGVMYMPYRDTITKLKQNILDPDKYEKNIDKFKKCSILLIDDMYKGRISKADINIIFEIVNYRYLNCLPVIISTELMIDEILRCDEAIGSRIYEMCKDYIISEKREPSKNYRLKR